MSRMVDLDDLIDAAGVASLLGLSHRNSVRTYRKRYASFPQPALDMGSGRCLLWLRSEVEKWARSTGRPLPQSQPPHEDAGDSKQHKP